MRILELFIIFIPKIITIMVVTFNEDYLENLYTNGKTGTKKIRFQPQIVRGYQKGIKYVTLWSCQITINNKVWLRLII